MKNTKTGSFITNDNDLLHYRQKLFAKKSASQDEEGYIYIKMLNDSY